MKIKDVLFAAVTGIGIGMPITIVCMLIIGGFNKVIMEFLVWLVASALFGVLSVIVFKKSERLNLIASTAIHCVGCLGITLGACAINGYSDNFFGLLLGIAPVFLVVYGVLYAVTLIGAKKEAKRLTESLEKKN